MADSINRSDYGILNWDNPTRGASKFNQKKPPDRRVCVAVDLLVAFDTVSHDNLLSKINRSQLHPATAR